MKLGYVGPKGTFTHFAVEKTYGSISSIELVAAQSLDQLFDGLSTNLYDAIFCPYENSSEGTVNRVLDNLTIHNDCFIHEMISMPISQSILGLYDIDVI
jgi:Prephenate dehydratase